MEWPKPFTDGSLIGAWLNKLLRACKSSTIKPGQGYLIKKQDETGTILEILPQNAGNVIFFRVCLTDGTTAYVPVRVAGQIYRTKGTVTTPPINSTDDVPTGAFLLE